MSTKDKLIAYGMMAVVVLSVGYMTVAKNRYLRIHPDITIRQFSDDAWKWLMWRD